MGLLSFLKSAAATPSARPVADAADDVQVLRLRARRRLIGAAVLVVLGVIGFPLVFETQPRPIPVDLPIDIPRKESAAPLVIPAPVVPVPAASLATAAVVEPAPEPVVEAATPAPLPAPSAQSAPTVPPLATPKLAVEKPKEKPAPVPAPRAEAARVQAMLEGRPPEAKASESATAAAGRFIVQVGAYADNKAAQEVRLKVEKLGLKTYVQAVDTADGRRIRVRVGPFATREEAGKVAAKVASGGGLKTVVLTL